MLSDATLWQIMSRWSSVTLAFLYRKIRLELERRAAEAHKAVK
jgi:hypothetical protein